MSDTDPDATALQDHQRRLRRIDAARTALRAAYAADPGGTERFQARMAVLTAAKKREQDRFEHVVLGNPRPKAPLPQRPKGVPKQAWKAERKRLAAKPEPQSLAEKWRGIEGTPETHENFEKTAHHRWALVKMVERGEITHDQRAWGDSIAAIAESIEQDVGVRIARYRMPVDNEGGRDAAHEALRRVREHLAYTRWRNQLPEPKRVVLDMLVYEQMSYHAAARRHRIGWRRAKRLLIEALDRWPDCVSFAAKQVDQQDLERMNGSFDNAA